MKWEKSKIIIEIGCNYKSDLNVLNQLKINLFKILENYAKLSKT